MISCEKTEIAGFHDKPVVESYLYADISPVVKISKLIPFSEEMEFSDMDVNKLDISIAEQSSGKKFTLTSIGDGKYENKNLIISEGKTYELSFPYNGEVVSATTDIPGKPKNVTISATNIAISQMSEPSDGGSVGPPAMPSPIEINWTNEDKSYYLLIVKNVESNKITINTHISGPGDLFRTQPTNLNHAELNTRSFQFYGLHRIILYKIQPEYVLFFQEISNSSLSLTEINANITNGFGIFTGVNSVSMYLYVGKP
jgi:hypothetical protein